MFLEMSVETVLLKIFFGRCCSKLLSEMDVFDCVS